MATKKTKKTKKDIIRKGANCSDAGHLLKKEGISYAGSILAKECGGLKAANKEMAKIRADEKAKKAKKKKK